MPALKEAAKQAALAREVLGHVDVVGGELERPMLSQDFIRRQAEQAVAPIQTRDAVYVLTDAVEALIESSERSSRQLVRLTAALVVLTVMIVGLTVLLVVSG